MLRGLTGCGSRLPALSRRLLCGESSTSSRQATLAAQPAATADAQVVLATDGLHEAPSSASGGSKAANFSSSEVPRASSSEVAASISPSEVSSGDAPVSAVHAEGVKEAAVASKLESQRFPGRAKSNIPSVSEEDLLQRFNERKGTQRRVSAWLFSDALQLDDPKIITRDVFHKAMPVLADIGFVRVIHTSLLFARKHDVILPTNVYNCALGGLMKEGKHEHVREAIEHMWTLPATSQPNATSYNQLIGAYFYNGMVEDAYDVLKDMKNKMIYPNWATYHALIAGCIRLWESQRAFETLLAVEQQNFKMSALTISQLLVMCASKNELPTVMQLMPRFNDALPRYWNEIDHIAARRAYRRAGNDLSDGGRLGGVPMLEISGIMSLMRCAYNGRSPELAEMGMDMLQKWYADSSYPDSAWYCLVGAYAASKDFTAAFDVIARMRKCGITPTLRELNESLVKPLSADIDLLDKQYYRLVKALKPDEVMPNDHSAEKGTRSALPVDDVELTDHDSPVFVAQDSERTDLVVENTTSEVTDASQEDVPDPLLVSLKDASGADIPNAISPGFVPVTLAAEERTVGIAELNAIIAACSELGDLDRAFHTYDEAQLLGLTPNTDTFNALIAGCIVDSHYLGGVRVFEELKESGVSFNSETIHLLVRLSIRCGKFVDARNWMLLAKEENVQVPTGAFQTLARKLMHLGRLADLRTVIALAEECGVSSYATLSRIDHIFLKDLLHLDGEEQFVTREPGQSGRRARFDHDSSRAAHKQVDGGKGEAHQDAQQNDAAGIE